MTWCKNPDRGLPRPDLVFYLDISTKDAIARASFGNERYEKAEFQERVAEIYKQLKSDDWKVKIVIFVTVTVVVGESKTLTTWLPLLPQETCSIYPASFTVLVS